MIQTSPSDPRSFRLACVQPGDFLDAVDRFAAGGEETYRGQRHSVESLQRLLSRVPHLVVSTGSSRPRETRGDGVYVASRPVTIKFLPQRWREKLRARRIIKEIAAFKPTHLIIRVSDVLGCELLSWANALRLPTGVNIASTFRRDHPPHTRFCQLANADNVLFVGNHNRVATKSLVDCGLKPEKAVAWEQPPRFTPGDYAVKGLGASTPRVMFAGSLIENKGVTDLVRACEIANGAFHVSICGDGPTIDQLRNSDAVKRGWAEVVGTIKNSEVVQRMRDATIVCVPTRHGFPEGLPLVLQEGLAVRTPVVVSDHPVFKEYFTEGTGVRFFTAGDASALARVIQAVASDEAAYAELSRLTADAWQSFQIETTLGDQFDRMGREWGILPANSNG